METPDSTFAVDSTAFQGRYEPSDTPGNSRKLHPKAFSVISHPSEKFSQVFTRTSDLREATRWWSQKDREKFFPMVFLASKECLQIFSSQVHKKKSCLRKLKSFCVFILPSPNIQMIMSANLSLMEPDVVHFSTLLKRECFLLRFHGLSLISASILLRRNCFTAKHTKSMLDDGLKTVPVSLRNKINFCLYNFFSFLSFLSRENEFFSSHGTEK